MKLIFHIKNYSIDSYGRQDVDNVGSGTGYYITNGFAVPIKWVKQTRDGKTKYTYLDGTEVKVNDGNTWIQIEPVGQNLVVKE